MLRPPQRLRKLIWDKLEPHLNDINTVIIIPDGELTRLPWAALPGREPDSVLLEDYAIATAENGQQLYARLTDPDTSGTGLFAVGGVAYDKNATKPSDEAILLAASNGTGPQRTRGPAMDERPKWDYLAGTAKETQAIKDLWGLHDDLQGVKRLAGQRNGPTRGNAQQPLHPPGPHMASLPTRSSVPCSGTMWAVSSCSVVDRNW